MAETFYVTTSIPYANDVPHVGHAMEFIMADVLARYHRQKGETVLFGTGTDEHGTKMAATAAKLNQDPTKLAAQMSQSFKDVHSLLNTSPDNFIRTTSEAHITSAQYIWKQLQPFIYKSTYTGWYCVGCETFVTETEVKANKGICPIHKKPYEKLEEENYFFKLKQYSQPLVKIIENDELRVIPIHRKNEILAVLRSGLEDISISRPNAKLSWGIPVPGDPTQVMYVWVEALMNYITQLDYPTGEAFKTFWPANVQVIGKDIVRFHAAIWPAMLLALKLPLPKTLYAHGFITMNGEKMSKSIGNVVAPGEIIKKYGVDAFRYYFLRHIPSYDDGDFTWERFDAAYHNELANELGNAVQRIASMVNRYQQGVIGEYAVNEHDTSSYHEAINNCQFDKALDWVWELIKGVNVFIEQEKPWQLAKDPDDGHLKEVLAACVSDILQIAELLLPFLPQTSAFITNIFKEGYVKNYSGVLFPRLNAEPKSS